MNGFPPKASRKHHFVFRFFGMVAFGSFVMVMLSVIASSAMSPRSPAHPLPGLMPVAQTRSSSSSSRSSSPSRCRPPPSPSTGNRFVLSPKLQALLYYASVLPVLPSLYTNTTPAPPKASNLIAAATAKIGWRFFPPRLLFTIGALARGLQMSTGLCRMFDPTHGVSALISIGSAWGGAPWVGRVVAGWVLSRALWDLAGAVPPS